MQTPTISTKVRKLISINAPSFRAKFPFFPVPSFYPLFPVPADLSTDVNLDVSHSEGLRIDQNIDERAPDVLIVPSKFKQFTKVLLLSIVYSDTQSDHAFLFILAACRQHMGGQPIVPYKGDVRVNIGAGHVARGAEAHDAV